MKKVNVRIVENSRLARLAGWKLQTNRCAMVLGEHILLHGITKQEILEDISLLRHEVCHVLQWKRMGYLRFLFFYLWWSFRYGYHKNPLEQEAREAEHDPEILKKILIHRK